MSYADDRKLFEQLAAANNRGDTQAYLIVRDCFTEQYRFRIPARLLPWDDMTPEEYIELTEMFIEKEVLEETGNDQMPQRLVKRIVKNIKSLYRSPIWRTRLW